MSDLPPDLEADHVPETNLATRSARGIAWSGGARVIGTGFQLVTVAILARFLAPAEFGLMAMAALYLALAQVWADLGLGSALIQREQVSRTHVMTAWWTTLAVGALLGLAGALLSRPLALFFREESLTAVVLLASLVFPLSAIGSVPQTMLARGMRFGVISAIEIGSQLTGAVVAVVLATLGAGVFALVAQMLVAAAVHSGAVVAATRMAPRLDVSRAALREMWGFSSGVLGANVLGYVHRRADDLLIGRVLGSPALGIYSVAYRLMLFPVHHVSWVILRVTFPAFARVQSSIQRMRDGYARLATHIAIVTFPLMGGLAALSHDVVPVVLTERFLDAIPLLIVLAPVGALDSVSGTANTVWIALGRSRFVLGWVAFMTAVLVVAILIGLPYGLLGVAVAYAAAAIPLALARLVLVARTLGLGTRELFGGLARPAAATLVMVAGVLVAREALVAGTSAPAVTRLLLLVPLGVALYLGVLALVGRRALGDLFGLLRGAVRDAG